MSSSSQPTLPFVLPFYQQLDQHLLRAIENSTYTQDIHAGARVGHEKLLKYKKIAFDNQYYILATGMLHQYDLHLNLMKYVY